MERVRGGGAREATQSKSSRADVFTRVDVADGAEASEDAAVSGRAEVAERVEQASPSERVELSAGVSRPSGLDTTEWKGSGHYEIVRRLGSGGMGVVYEAIDRRSGQHLALKTLPEFAPAALYQLKQEFRILAGLRHRNLVRLHELVATETERIFFTMELVDGVDFLQHVCSTAAPSVDASLTMSRPRAEAPARPFQPGSHRPAVSYEKLRPALRQLVEGLRALHEAGKLHRDVKPSNVLVTPEGRVVLLDFGVATELPRPDRTSGDAPGDDLVVGTPKYMSPEQVAGETMSAASDLYSVGVMLYEAVVGEAPFEGSALDIMTSKVAMIPSAPSQRAEGVPKDLEELCMGLLRMDPSQRPNIDEVLRMLGSSVRARSDAPGAGPSALLVGREAERRVLRRAFEESRTGQAITVRVSGQAGMGKSALVRAFLDEIQAGGQANVLSGRAYERESVPYKAVDGVIDALSQLLVELAAEGAQYVPPGARKALARLFPVLLRVPEVGEPVDAPDDDPQEERRRAFQGLRDCLVSLARSRPLAIFIDDVQWGDTDSVALLVEVMRQPGAPGILLLMTSREEDANTSPFLAEMATTWPGEVREVHVGRLAQAEAHALALSLIGTSATDPERVARAVVREGRGSPLLLHELVRHRHDVGDGDETLVSVSLEQMVARRLEALPAPARKAAEAVAVAGRPLSVASLAAASGVVEGAAEVFALLEAQGLARTAFRGDREVAEPAHDRIREVVVSLLAPLDLREHHRRLAAELTASPGSDLEALAMHLLGMGETDAAWRAAERAAEQAIAKLAFEQATRLLRTALEAVPEGGAEALRLRARLAETLVFAGRPGAAADEYAKAAARSTAMERVELERAAAEHLLSAGRIDEGRLAFHRVLDAMGVKLPRTVLGGMLLLLVYQILLRIAGLRFRERKAADVSLEDRTQIEALRAVGAGLRVVDMIMGMCAEAKHLLIAMERGEQMQVLRGLCNEIIQHSIVGGREGTRERKVIAAARELTARIGPDVAFHLEQALGLALYMRGHFLKAIEKCDSAARMAPGGFIAANARLFALYSCYFSGRFGEAMRRAPRLLKQAEERGDMYTAVCLRTTMMVDIALANDDPEEGRRQVREAMSNWTQKGFLVQHWYAMWSEACVELYRGEGTGALARLERDARALRRSFLLQAELVWGVTMYLRGCAVVAAIENVPASLRERVAEARRIARRIEKAPAVWAPTYGTIVRAGAESAAGDRASAAASLREAIRHAEEADLDSQARAARYQLGRALGGDEGRELVARAEREMRDEGVKSPERMAAFYVPGRWA